MTAAPELEQGPVDRSGAAGLRAELQVASVASGLLLLLDAHRLIGRLPLEIQVQVGRLRHAVKVAIQAQAGRPTPMPGPGRRRRDPSRDQGHPGRHRGGSLGGRPVAPSRRHDRPAQPDLLHDYTQCRGDGPLPCSCLDLHQEAAVSLRFADLNPLGRAIILVVAALTFGVAAVSFATSYGALYAYARDTGLYSDRLTRLWPLLLDGAFIVAQLGAILAGILRGSRGWRILTMLLTGALTVWFNLQHAGSDPGRRLTAALPPVLMMLAFEIDVQIVK